MDYIAQEDPNKPEVPDPSFTGNVCLKTGKPLESSYFCIGKKRYNLKSRVCWLSGEPLVKKHYRVFCFTRQYDGVNIYRPMNPDSRAKWCSNCAKTGKPIIGPYVKAIG